MLGAYRYVIVRIIMAKSKKKRNKKYSGADASSNRPKITKVQAVSRSKPGQWLYERKRLIKPVGIAVVVILVIALIVSGIISLF